VVELYVAGRRDEAGRIAIEAAQQVLSRRAGPDRLQNQLRLLNALIDNPHTKVDREYERNMMSKPVAQNNSIPTTLICVTPCLLKAIIAENCAQLPDRQPPVGPSVSATASLSKLLADPKLQEPKNRDNMTDTSGYVLLIFDVGGRVKAANIGTAHAADKSAPVSFHNRAGVRDNSAGKAKGGDMAARALRAARLRNDGSKAVYYVAQFKAEEALRMGIEGNARTATRFLEESEVHKHKTKLLNKQNHSLLLGTLSSEDARDMGESRVWALFVLCVGFFFLVPL
jgi:hypothetical protein